MSSFKNTAPTFPEIFFYSVFYRFSSTAYNETHSNQGHLTKFSASLTGKKSHHAIHYKPGAHQQEPATTPYSCGGVFTDRSIFSLNLSPIQIRTGTSVTNCNHKHGLMLTCSRDVSSVSPSSERITNARNVSFRISSRWPSYIVNSVDKTKLSCNTPTDAAPQFL